MSWASIMSYHAISRASIDWMVSHPLRRGDIGALTRAVFHVAWHGEPTDLQRLQRYVADYTWPHAKAATVLQNPAEPLGMIVAGPAIAALNDDRAAITFLTELGATSGLRRHKARAAAAIAASLMRGTWEPSIYHDGLTYSQGNWKLRPSSAEAATLLRLARDDWEAVRAHVDKRTWRTIEKHRPTQDTCWR